MPSKRFSVLVGSVLLVVVFGFLLGYALGPLGFGSGGQIAKNKSGAFEKQGHGDSPVPAPESESVDSNGFLEQEEWAFYKPREGAPLYHRTFYTRCGHFTEEAGLVSAEMATKTLGQLGEEYSDWRVFPADFGGVSLERVINDFCMEDRVFRHIGLKDGYVAIFHGRPRSDAVLKTLTDIAAKDLYPADRKRLEAGIVAVGDVEIEKVLEGLID